MNESIFTIAGMLIPPLYVFLYLPGGALRPASSRASTSILSSRWPPSS